MKPFVSLVFLLLLVNLPTLAQDTTFTLSGTITDCQTKQPIPGVTVKLLCSDGRAIEKLSDPSGYYYFDHRIVRKNLAYVVTTQVYSDISYLGSSEKFRFSTADSSTQRMISKDFCLVKNERCEFILPSLHFKKNSYDSFSIDPENYELDMLTDIMADNPRLVFEISSHAGRDENDALQLSQKRGEYVQDILIKKGIEKKRLVIHAYGSEKPFVTASESDKLKTQAEKEAAFKKNRRVAFTILRNNFQSGKTN